MIKLLLGLLPFLCAAQTVSLDVDPDTNLSTGIRVSQLHNHWAIPSTGAIVIWDCAPVNGDRTNATLRPLNYTNRTGLKDFTDGAPNSEKPAEYIRGGCWQSGNGGSSNSPVAAGVPDYAFSWVGSSVFNISGAFTLLTSSRKHSTVHGYDLSSSTLTYSGASMIQDFTASEMEFYVSTGIWSGTSPRTDSALTESAQGQPGTYIYPYTPNNWAKSVSGSSLVSARDTFTLSITTPAFTVGAKGINAGGYGSDDGADATIYVSGIWTTPFTQRDVSAANRAVRKHLQSVGALATDYAGMVAFVGDSLTAAGTLLNDVVNRMPNQVMTALSATRKLDWANEGVSARYVSNINTNIATMSGECALWGATHIAVLWAGTNDFALGSASASTTETAFSNAALALHNAGCKVVGVTIIPREDVDIHVSAQAFNTWLNANVSGGACSCAPNVDVVADPASNAAFNTWSGGSASWLNATYYLTTDHVHLTAAGYTIVAGLVVTAIESVW